MLLRKLAVILFLFGMYFGCFKVRFKAACKLIFTNNSTIIVFVKGMTLPSPAKGPTKIRSTPDAVTIVGGVSIQHLPNTDSIVAVWLEVPNDQVLLGKQTNLWGSLSDGGGILIYYEC